MADELDPEVSRRYRELRAEEPSRELDQAILAAAHRAADRPHAPLVAPAGRHRWYFAFGAAAVLVLAVAITVQLDRQEMDSEALQPSTVPAPPDRADRFYSPVEKENKEQVEPSKPLADAAPPPARERRKAPPQQTAPAVSPPAEAKPQAAEEARAPAAAPVPQAPPAPAQADSRDQLSGAAAGMLRQEQVRKSREAAPAAAPSPEATTGPQANVQESRAVASIAPPLGPERLLERIAELRREGKHEEADKALADFRQRFPDYRISEEMLKRVERGK